MPLHSSRDYLREQPPIAILLYAGHLVHPGGIEFLGVPTEGGAETGLVERAPYAAATSLEARTTVTTISAPLYTVAAAGGVATR